MAWDLVLSSGFLAFARQVGFLRAVERAGLEVDAIVGTSSGALVGSLWAAGIDTDALLGDVGRRRPRDLMRFNWSVWKGVFSAQPTLDFLRERLPATFEELPRPFASGVVGPDGRYRLLTSGPLPEAVMASCCMPRVFVPMTIDGQAFSDGGAAERVGLVQARAWRGERPTIVHLVDSTHSKADSDVPEGVPVVRSERSGASFWSLGDFASQAEETERAAREVLAALAS